MSAFARVIAIGLLFFAMLSAAVSAAERLDDKPRIAVVSAFPPEWVALQTDLSDRTTLSLSLSLSLSPPMCLSTCTVNFFS